MDRIREIAAYVLDGLRAAGADDAECRVSETRATELSYESGKISMIRSLTDIAVAMTAIRDHKKGTVATNFTSRENLDACIRDAMDALAVALPDEANGVCDEEKKVAFRDGVLDPDRAAMMDRMEEFLRTAKKEHPLIRFDSVTLIHERENTLVLNTRGCDVTESGGLYLFEPTFMAVEGDVSSSFNYSYFFFGDIEKPLIEQGDVRRQLTDSERQIHPRTCKGKRVCDVVLAPGVYEEMIESLCDIALSDVSLIDGTSIYKDKIGKKIASDGVTVWSAPRSEELINGTHTTGDAYLIADMPIIEDGILKNYTIGRYGAKKTGLPRSASDGGNLVVPAGERTLDAMIRDIPYGILVNRFSGGSPASNGDFSGVAKNSFLIENGRVTDAVSETMISGNLARMMESVKDVSRERLNNGSSLFPWARVGGITVSGK